MASCKKREALGCMIDKYICLLESVEYAIFWFETCSLAAKV